MEKQGVNAFCRYVLGTVFNGITIDHTTNMMGSGFTFENPNATGGCGCGTSFSA